MYVRFLPVVGMSALALAAAAAFAPDASASHSTEGHPPSTTRQISATKHQTPVAQVGGCRYSQTEIDTGDAVDSTFHYDQPGDQALDDFSSDDEAIDDFRCNSKKPTVTISTVTAWGQENSEFPFGSFEVTIYEWNGGAPVGAVVCDGNGEYSRSSGPPGSFKYVIGMRACTLTRHVKYWLKVQAWDGCFHECSYWSWSMLTPSAHATAYWRQPNRQGDCMTWRTLSDCITKDNVAYDLAFAI